VGGQHSPLATLHNGQSPSIHCRGGQMCLRPGLDVYGEKKISYFTWGLNPGLSSPYEVTTSTVPSYSS